MNPKSSNHIVHQQAEYGSTLHDSIEVKTKSKIVLPGEQSASILNEIFNLIKNIVGSGGFSLPAAIAAYGNNPSALYPAAVLIVVMGIINAYTFSLLGRICCLTESRTYKEAWKATVGKRHESADEFNGVSLEERSSLIDRPSRSSLLSWGANIVAIVVVAKTFMGCWAFSIMLSSSFQPLLYSLGFTHISPPQAITLLSLVVLLPLCMSRTLSALAGFSALGQLGTVFAVIVMIWRYFDGTYKAPDGLYFRTLPQKYEPKFGDDGALAVFHPQALILVSILSTGYVAHYNAPKFYFELKNHSPERFNVVVGVSFFCSAIIYFAVSSIGFLSFGGNCAGYILDNYSTDDPLAFVARLGIILSLSFSYPLLFIGGREGLLDLCKVPLEDRSVVLTRTLSFGLLVVITGLSIIIPELTFVLAFGGATLSTCLIYIFPALMLRAMVLNWQEGKYEINLGYMSNNHEVNLNLAILCCGVVAGICGATIAVLDARANNTK